MNILKYKIFYEWFLWIIALSLLVAFIVLLVYFNSDAWIGITCVFCLWFLISVFTTIHIFNSDRMPNVKLSWIICIMCMPLIGIVIFFWFGIFPFKKKKLKEYAELYDIFQTNYEYDFGKRFLQNPEISEYYKKAFSYGLNIKKPISSNNNIELLSDIDTFYKSIIDTIKSAKKFINIQTYIVRKSTFFNVIADLLIKKAQEGIIVNFMYDWVGSFFKNPKNKIYEMKKSGIHVAIFNTFKYNPITGKTNYRSHRKCLIVDNKIAIYGGSNLSDDYFNLVPLNNFWKDINFKIEGTVVNYINILFAIDWENYTFHSISKEIKLQFLKNKEFYFEKNKFNYLKDQKNEVICQFIESSPLINESTIHDIILNLVGIASKKIWITTPYFSPSNDIINQLIIAAYAGIDVRLILPGNSDDKKYIVLINRSTYKRLIDAGIKIYEYYGFMHGKELIIDDELSLIGTFNFDHRSLYSNFETAVLIKNKEWNNTLSKEFLKLTNTSRFITYEFWISTQTLFNRLKAKTYNLLNPLF